MTTNEKGTGGQHSAAGKCAGCGAGMNAGEAAVFTVCDACWGKAYPKAIPTSEHHAPSERRRATGKLSALVLMVYGWLAIGIVVLLTIDPSPGRAWQQVVSGALAGGLLAGWGTRGFIAAIEALAHGSSSIEEPRP